MRRFVRSRVWWGVLSLLALSTAPLPPGATRPALAGPSSPDAASPERRPAHALRFVGIDGLDPYDPATTDPRRLEAAGKIGALVVRTTPIPWGRIEPHAPVMGGRHLHDWDALDRFVAAWGEAGADVVLVLSPESPWASAARKDSATAAAIRKDLPAAEAEPLLHDLGTPPPLATSWDDWRSFVRSLVERYDGDGREDAPHLPRPLRWIQIVEHPARPDCFCGSPAEYLHLLDAAGLGAAEASADVRIAHGTVDFQGAGRDPAPDDEELVARGVARLHDAPDASAWWARREIEFPLFTLEMTRLFGAVPHEGSPDTSDESVDLSFLRRRLDDAKRPDIEVWLVDAPAAHLGPSDLPGAVGPGPEECRVRARWAARSRWPTGEGVEQARAWVRRGEAFDVVRTVCAARAAGATRVFLGGARGAAGATGLDVFVGDAGDAPPSSEPAAHALAQLLRLLGGAESVQTFEPSHGVKGYRFRFPPRARSPWVDVLVLGADTTWAGRPGGSDPTRELVLPLPDGAYVAEPTDTGPGTPAPEVLHASGGGLRLTIGPAPVYVRPED